MKPRPQVKDTALERSRRTVPSWVLRLLRSLPGILDAITDDGDLTLRRRNAVPIRYELMLNAAPGSAELEALLKRRPKAKAAARLPLLTANQLSPKRRQQLSEAGISWIERATGVCHLVGPDLLIHVEQRPADAAERKPPAAKGKARPVRLVAVSGVVVETILLLFRGRPIKVTELASAAGASPGLVSRILQRLEREGVLETEGKGPRTRRLLSEAGKLLDLWAQEDPPAPDSTASLYLWTPSPDRVYASLPKLDSAGIPWALAGAAAANHYAPTLTTLPTTEVWVAADVPSVDVAKALDAEPVDRGANILVLQKEGDPALRHATRDPQPRKGADGGAKPLRTVSQPRAYVESLHGFGRAPEVAQRLRESLGY